MDPDPLRLPFPGPDPDPLFRKGGSEDSIWQKVYGELCTCNFSSNYHNLFLVLCTNEAVWIVVAPLLRVRVAVRFQAPIVLALVALHFQRSPGGAIYSVFTYFHLELIELSAREVLILWTLVEKEEQGWGGGRRGPRLSLMRG